MGRVMPSSSAAREMLPPRAHERLPYRVRLGVLSDDAQIERRAASTAIASPRSSARHELAFGHDHRGLDLVLHLADVAGPRVGVDRVVRVVGEALDVARPAASRTC